MSDGFGASFDGRSVVLSLSLSHTHTHTLSLSLSLSISHQLVSLFFAVVCRFPGVQELGEEKVVTREPCPGPVQYAVPWTHFLQLSALRTVKEQSPLEAKLSQWRAGSLAAGALANSWEFTGQVEARKNKTQDLLTGMKWERVLAAEMDIGLKLSLWKSQARARREQREWNVDNAVLSVDFERSASGAGAFSPGQKKEGGDQNSRAPPPLPAPWRTKNNMLPGISAAPSVARRAVVRLREDSDIVSYTREMTRTLEPQALVMGKRLLESMERRHVFPSTIFFNALLAACTGKSVAKGVGPDGTACAKGGGGRRGGEARAPCHR